MAATPKLTDDVVQAICARKRADPALTQDALAAEFNLNRTSIKKALMMLNVQESGDSGISMIDYGDITLSPLNPRKTFPEDALAELAESIAVNGLLQNLVVRNTPNGKYILVAGERRYRAIGLLIDAGRWDSPLPCRVIDADDGNHLAIALLENLQRQDVAPLEEADAFQQLQQIDPALWTAQAIAGKIGRTPRYVYGRLAIAKKLSPAARDAFAKGRINIEAARLLTTASPEIQTDILDRASDYDDDGTGKIEVENITYELRGTLFAVDDAIFDAEASGLEIVEVDGQQFFADRKPAIDLQMRAVDLKVKQLAKKWRFAYAMEPGENFPQWQFLSGKTKADGAGAIITISKPRYQVLCYEGVLKKPEQADSEKPAKIIDTSEYEAARLKSQAEREAKAKAESDRFHALTPKLPTDYPITDDERQPGQQFCFDGCKWRATLAHPAPHDFLVCTSPTSPRAGMLTYDEQGGQGCFEVA